MIQEAFGDGIMSAIDFTMEVGDFYTVRLEMV